ncbi:hypothetical protein D7B24_005075 [Verticillium nonalfalfae]|uniref:Prolyl 4-hydroxylase alpha subunit Fe(2+) 2OG dioxygenase domain-containing protein n=1 Tax=Verticillium nonalfalfae TaxID=1051616 RepID=A0A3M9YMJ3_9PEZI|nr:uncharacterized protein D7B24_005075 [Verticillium nonalfalfae]RNJ60986.1 hypothetical protein D7B24_005075 [Verticillium nonalfalfae]
MTSAARLLWAHVVSETMPKAKTPASPGVPGKVKEKGQGQAIQTAASMSTSTSSPASTAATASSKAPPPAWPPFKPALPVTDLLPEPLEQCPDKVVLLPNFWPKSLCNTFVAFLRGLALETTPGGRPKRNMAARVNDRFQVDDPAFARRLWLGTGLRDALQREDVRALWGGDVVGLNSNIRVYRYTQGQYFDAHWGMMGTMAIIGGRVRLRVGAGLALRKYGQAPQ